MLMRARGRFVGANRDNLALLGFHTASVLRELHEPLDQSVCCGMENAVSVRTED